MISLKTLLRASTLTAIAATGLTATGAQAQVASSSVSASAKVKILKPVTITEDEALSFGTVIVGGVGSVSLPATAAGVAVCTSVTCLAGTSSSGQFTVAGTKNEKFSVTMPTTISMTGPGTLVLTLTNNVPTAGAKLDNTGQYKLAVGGSFAVTALQPEGTYTGTYSVAIDYN